MFEPVPSGNQRSNYIREIEEEKYESCGLCVRLCPMNALEIKDKKVIFNPDCCIGCGVCFHKCPTGAIYLKHRHKDQKFLKDLREQAYRLLKERGNKPLEIFKKHSL